MHNFVSDISCPEILPTHATGKLETIFRGNHRFPQQLQRQLLLTTYIITWGIGSKQDFTNIGFKCRRYVQHTTPPYRTLTYFVK